MDRELNLVEQVHLRLTLARDDQLQASLAIYLCPLLRKLKSAPPVRAKTVEVLSYISQRLRPQIGLPGPQLLELLHEQSEKPEEDTQMKTFLVVYLKKYLSAVGAAQYVLELAKDLQAQPPAVQPLVFELLLNGMREWAGKDDRPDLEFGDDHFLSRRFAHLFLFDLAFKSSGSGPGLNPTDYQFQLAASPTEGTHSGNKKAVLKFLETSSWPLDLTYMPLLCASADRLSDIAQSAMSAFQRLPLDANNARVELLFGLAVGANAAPVRNSLQVRILAVLTKFPERVPDNALPLVQGAFQSGDNKRLDGAVKLIRALATAQRLQGPQVDEYIQQVRDLITASGWPKLLTPDAGRVKLRNSSYETMGLLLRSSSLQSINSIRFLFQSVERDSDSVASAQEALSEVLRVVDRLPAPALEELKDLLARTIVSASGDATKYSVVRYAVRALPFSDTTARLVCLQALDPQNRADVRDEARRGLNPYLYLSVNAVYGADITAVFPGFEQALEAVQASKVLAMAPAVADAAIHFLFQALVMQAAEIRVDEHWAEALDAAAELDSAVRAKIAAFIASTVAQVGELLTIAFKGLLSTEYVYASKVWQVLLTLSPQELRRNQVDKMPALVGRLAQSANVEAAAESLALICPQSETEALTAQLQPLTKGSSLALAYLLCRLSLYEIRSDFEQAEKVAKYAADHNDSAPLYQLAIGGLLPATDELVELLVKRGSKGDEKAILTLGALRISNTTKAQLFLDKLLAMNSARNIDVLLANGEAVSIAATGWPSAVLDQQRPPDLDLRDGEARLVDYALDKVFAGAKQTAPDVRRASCVRLLCLVQYNAKDMSGRLAEAQACFMRFLAMNDEIAQEAASRGLSLVYESGNASTKEELVQQLVSSFTSDRSRQGGTVTEDTELFAPGMLSTGEGSVSTYKDVLSLAAEVGDSTLVYKFMSLASSSQMWSSRRGLAFGLESIMAKAGLDDDIASGKSVVGRRLVPKLFRYIFDPNSQVQAAMKSIWDALVVDRPATVRSHFDDIFAELETSAVAREWRTRQAAASAIANLVETVPFATLAPKTEIVWRLAFRTLDDIKDSVRTVGLQLAKTLTSGLARRLEAGSAGSQDVLKTLIPLLMGNRGIQAESEEVRTFALGTLLRIAKSGSADFAPYMLDFVDEFTLLLSTLEPQAMNYLALNAGNFGVDATTVDENRAKGVIHSPIMETLELLVERMTGDELAEFVKRLPAVVKRTVGLPSKLGAARLVIFLCMRFPRTGDFNPLLTACAAQLNDRNDLVTQTFAAASGYVCRLTPSATVLEYVDMLKQQYFSVDSSDRQREIAALAVKAISRHASDQFSGIASTTLPFVYVGQHDSDEQVAGVFKDVWTSNTGGTGAVRLYWAEISALAAPHLASPSWALRGAAARSIAGAAEFADQQNDALVKQLLDALAGRTWTGKEHVFEAFVKTSLAGMSSDNQTAATARLVNELQRRNLEYKVSILPTTGAYLAKYPSAEVYKVFMEAASSILLPQETGDEDEEMSDVTEDAKLAVLDGVVKGYHTGYDLEPSLETILDASFSGWKFKVAACKALATLGAAGFFSQAVWDKSEQLCARDFGHEIVRLEWVRAAGALKKYGVEESVKSATANETSSVVLAEVKKAFQS